MSRINSELRHFLDLMPMAPTDLRRIQDAAHRMKRLRKEGKEYHPLRGKKLAMIFEKNSTRTRVSFEVAMAELGGHALYLTGNDMQLGRGETIADTARVLSRYVDAIVMRTFKHDTLMELAQHATVPVVNGLTDYSHPCQIMADIQTFEEHCGSIEGRTIAWVGDGNNVATSWITAAPKFKFEMRLACPPPLMPAESTVIEARREGGQIHITTSPEEAVKEAEAVITDTWVSMGDTDADKRMAILEPYQVNRSLMMHAKKDAIFMHCLPAHRGEEVTEDVIDGPHSVVWDEAENRLHVQKAILVWCLNPTEL